MAKATVTFGGMNTEQLDSFNAALDKYIKTVEEDINAINQVKLSSVLKGEALTSLKSYLNAALQSMKAYLDELEEYKTKAEAAKDALLEGAKGVAANIDSAASSFNGGGVNLE